MADPISKKMRKKLEDSAPKSDWVRIKDKNNKIIIDKDNPFIGRLLKHEYVEADNPKYGNDEGKKHILTWLTKEDGEKVKKKQSTTSDWFMRQLVEVNNDEDTWDFVWWYEQQGPKQTIPHVQAYEKSVPQPPEEEEEEPDFMPEKESNASDFEAGKDPDDVDDDAIDVEKIPF